MPSGATLVEPAEGRSRHVPPYGGLSTRGAPTARMGTEKQDPSGTGIREVSWRSGRTSWPSGRPSRVALSFRIAARR